MLSLEERADLLVRVAELVSRREQAQLITLLSDLPEPELISEPELGLRLALAYFQLSQYGKAQILVDRLAQGCMRGGYDQLYRRYLNIRGNLLLEKGDTLGAEAAYLEVLQRSIVADDQRWVAFATINLGAVSGIRGEWMKAITAAHRGMTALQRIGDAYNLAACHQNLALAYRELRLHSRADSHFEKAAQLYRSTGFEVSIKLASLAVERAVSIGAAGDYPRAEAKILYAMGCFESLQTQGHFVRRDIGEALRALGIVQLAQSRYSEARNSLVRALETAREESALLLEGEVCEGLFALAAAEKKGNEALRWAGEAETVYARLGAHARIREMRLGLRHSAAS